MGGKGSTDEMSLQAFVAERDVAPARAPARRRSTASLAACAGQQPAERGLRAGQCCGRDRLCEEGNRRVLRALGFACWPGRAVLREPKGKLTSVPAGSVLCTW
jgi:hypothetical protein